MILTESSQNKLKEIRDSHKFCCLTISSDYNYVWLVKVIDALDATHKRSWVSGNYEDLNDAVDSLYSQIDQLLK